jgi:hypothetical protein
VTSSDREQVRQVMKRRARDAWVSGEVGEGVGHLNRPYGSHANRTWHKLGECAIAFLGELPEAEAWLDYAVNKFYACYPAWADDDGGWHEGVNYWAGYMGKVVWWLQVARSALGIDGFQKPFFAQVGDFPPVGWLRAPADVRIPQPVARGSEHDREMRGDQCLDR